LRLNDVAFISTETHAEMSNSQVKPLDVLVNITGASIGRCTFVPEGFGEANVNQHVCILRPSHRIDSRFLGSYLTSPFGQGDIFSGFTGASRQGLTHTDLGIISVPLPPLEVQQETMVRMDSKLSQLTLTTDIIAKQIDTLTAYRKSLIHQCVTGQRRIIDEDVNRVTAHAASLA
jgi:type I restriction enzyme S subunit